MTCDIVVLLQAYVSFVFGGELICWLFMGAKHMFVSILVIFILCLFKNDCGMLTNDSHVLFLVKSSLFS